MRNKYLPLIICSALISFAPVVYVKAQDPDGLWGNLRQNESPDTQKEEISELTSLSYLQGYILAPKEKNVTIYNKKLAWHGYNFFTSGHAPEAILMDMDGNILHRWYYPIERVWPDIAPEGNKGTFWVHARLLNNGELLAIYDKIGLIKLDKNSHLIWSYRQYCHHTTDIDENGNIYVLTAIEKHIENSGTILDNLITILTPDGKLIRQISFYDMFQKSPYKEVLDHINKYAQKKEHTYADDLKIWIRHTDVFHTNTLKILDGKHADLSPAFKKGNILVCFRNAGAIAIVDQKTESIVWLKHRHLWNAGQHDATLLDNGHMVIFDNYYKQKESRILEFDPLTEEITWEYRGTKQNPFFTSTSGTNQRLPNGNTLITESFNGRAFEVTPDKKIVWEFYNPNRTGKNNELIAVILEMKRLNPDFPLGWVKR